MLKYRSKYSFIIIEFVHLSHCVITTEIQNDAVKFVNAFSFYTVKGQKVNC